METYVIRRNGVEALVARLVPETDTSENRIEIGYAWKGMIMGASTFSKGCHTFSPTVHVQYLDGLSRLGPILRDQLPDEWRDEVLGGWFERRTSEEAK